MTENRIVRQPRKPAATIYSLVLIITLYAIYKLLTPGFPFSLLLAPALFGRGLLVWLLASAGMEQFGGVVYWLAWLVGALVLWYVYYKLIYFLLWLFGIHQPLKAASDDPDAELTTDNEGGWMMRAFIVALFPAVIGIMLWQSVTSFDAQYSHQHKVVQAAAEIACKDNGACHDRIESHFDQCFDAHFVENGRKWLRAKYAVDRESFRNCLFPDRKMAGS